MIKRLINLFFVVAVFFLFVSCGDEKKDTALGSEGGACFENGTCDEGLDCLLGVCVNPGEITDNDSGDSGNSGNTGGIGPADSGTVDSNIPQPIISVKFDETVGGPVSYRNIKDDVKMNLEGTCVSDPDNNGKCLADWSEKYYIKYKWEMVESPTPDMYGSQLDLYESHGVAGNWFPDYANENPKLAKFTGLMVTPRISDEDNPDLDESKCESECGEKPSNVQDASFPVDHSEFVICSQKYCEKKKTTYYKVKIQAVTVDLETGDNSETSEVTVVPQIISHARVIAQLTWKQGFATKTEAESDMEGTKTDLDIHMIKRSSLEAATFGYTPTDGVMCTSMQFEGMNYSPTEDIDGDEKPDYESFFRHDDCYFADQGFDNIYGQPVTETVAWNATFDLNNTWGGGNYKNPETIGLGTITDENGDGKPDKDIIDDQYLVVVNYAFCTPKGFEDTSWNTCCNPADSSCNGDGSAYEIDARVDILIDGVPAPRAERVDGEDVLRPADNYSETSRSFKIRPDEWKVVAVIKWDSSLPSPVDNPKFTGDAVVSDVAMPDAGIETDASSYKTCRFDVTLCEVTPIWDVQEYYSWVDSPQNPDDETSPSNGDCY